MKRSFILLGVLLLAVLLGWGMASVPGVLVLELGQKTFAAPLWLIGLGLLVLILMSYAVWKLFFWVIYLPFGWRDSWLNFKKGRREKLLRSALEAQVLDNHAEAWIQFRKLARSGYLTPQSYYCASVHAEKAGESAMATDLLFEAGRAGGAGTLAYLLLQIDRLIRDANFPEAKRKFNLIPKEFSRDPNVLKRGRILEKY